MGAGAAQGGQKIVFFQHGHMAYKIEGDDEHNRMQAKFHPGVKLVIFGEVRRSNINKFQSQSQFLKIFIPNLVCILTNKRYKTY